MRRAAGWVSITAAATLLQLQPAANGYYFFVHYLTRSAPWIPVAEKFDVAALQDRRVPFLIADQAPGLAAGDSFAAVTSQIRAAARAWNQVDSADVELAFGGYFTPGTQHGGPVIEVVFGEIPPGLRAMTSATVGTEAVASVTPGAPPFVPITKSTVVLNRDLNRTPSWTQDFFLTVTHEFGHALGLQHSFTSGVMATEAARATTKARPLAIDDIVGLSLLYPVRGGLAGSGVIAGRVTSGGAGVALASVVAISLDGAAIGALTNPDGTYRIEGIPAGSYYVYTHALPPRIGGEAHPGGILPPLDFSARAVPATGLFETTFYPGGRTFDRASPVQVFPGGAADGINFAVNRRDTLPVYGVLTYSFPGPVAVQPAFLAPVGGASFAVAAGFGLTPRSTVAVLGQSVSVAPNGVKAYPVDPRFTQIDFQFSFSAGEGPRHLTFTTDGETHVVPAGIRVVRGPAPSIGVITSGLDATGARTASLFGSGFGLETQVLFDGVLAAIRQASETLLVVTPPPAPPGHRAVVSVINPDGQSSQFVQTAPSTFDFDATGDWNFTVSPAQVAAGTEALVEITGANAGFQAGQVSAGFGSSTIQVLRMWNVGTNRLLANVWVAPNTPPGTVPVTVVNGLRTAVLPGGFSIAPANPRQIQLRGPVVDVANGRTEIAAGAVGSVRLLTPAGDVPAASIQVLVSDRPAVVTGWSGGTLLFRVPVGVPPGPAVLRVAVGSESASLAMVVDAAPPAIAGIQSGGAPVDAQRPARPGQLIVVSMTGTPEGDLALNRVSVQVNGLGQTVASVAASPGGHTVQFLLDELTQAGTQQLTVAVDGRVSAPFALPVRTN